MQPLQPATDIANLDSAALAGYLNSVDLFQEACKYATHAPRDPELNIALVENCAMNGSVSVTNTQGFVQEKANHPALTAFIIRQSVTGHDFISPRFVPDLLLPYLENVLGLHSMSLTALVGSTTEKKALTFDADPDAETLFIFLEAMAQRRADGIDDLLDYCVRSLALLHYAVRVMQSGKLSPASNTTSPSRTNTALPSPQSNRSAGAAAAAAAAAAANIETGAGGAGGSRLTGLLLGHFDSDENMAGNHYGSMFPSGSIASLPHTPVMMSPSASQAMMRRQANGGAGAGAGAEDVDPPLPKQEPLSGTRRVHRKWDQWLEIGKRAFFDNSNLPVMVDGVSYTACACFTEALEEYCLSRGVGPRPSQQQRQHGTNTNGDSRSSLLNASNKNSATRLGLRDDDFLSGPPAAAAGGGAAAAAAAASSSTMRGGGRNLFGDNTTWDSPVKGGNTVAGILNFDDDGTAATTVVSVGSAATTAAAAAAGAESNNNNNIESELWNLLSQSISVGGSAVTVMGEMHTKESAMAMSVQADMDNADRWLDLARLLPSETGKKRISKRKQQKSAGAGNLGVTRGGAGTAAGAGGGRQGNNGPSSSSSASRGRNLNLGAGFSSSPSSASGVPSPAPARAGGGGGGRKLGLGAFDDFDFSTPAHSGTSGNSNKNNNNNNNNNNNPPTAGGDTTIEASSSRRTTTTREVTPTVDGATVNRVQAYAESLKRNDSRPEVWSELGLHMPLHPPFDSIFISNSSYNSRRCHETSLEKDPSLADSWLDLGWQLMEDKKISAIKGKVYNATDCFLEALAHCPTDIGEAWSLLGQSLDDRADATVTVGSGSSHAETLTKIECFRRALHHDEACISAWIGLGRMLQRGSTTEVHGKTFTQLGLFYHALEMDDSDAVAWNGLGAMLGPVDKAVFRGETYTRRQCYLQALACDPYLARVWNNLGLDLGDTRVPRNMDAFGELEKSRNYVIFNNRKFDNKACFVRALHCEGGNVSTSWVNLGMLLSPDAESEGSTVIINGKPCNKKKCYYEAVRANEHNAIAWNNLGAVMDPTETVVVNKQPCDKLMCYRNALENDETLSNAWYNAVCVMIKAEKDHGGGSRDHDERLAAKLRFRVRGRDYNKVDCAMKAVEMNPENGNAWKLVADLMKDEGVKSFLTPANKKLTHDYCMKMVEKYPVKD